MTIASRQPKRDTSVAKALAALHQLGGAAPLMVWANACTWRAATCKFTDDIVGSLLSTRTVYLDNDVYKITWAGLAYLGVAPDPEPAPPAPVAGPRYVAPIRALTCKNNWRDVARDGALDYRDIPSRIGDELVEYGGRSSATATGRTTT